MRKYILLLNCLIFISCAEKKLADLPSSISGSVDQLPPPTDMPDSGLTSDDKNLEKLSRDVAFYKSRYQMPDVYKKITNDRGNDFEDLYGTRNMREVLAGVYYRGGGNNKYHKKNPRSNTNPLPADGLINLCQDGFVTSLYFYETNYKSAKPVNPCFLRNSGDANTLNYQQLTAFSIQDFRPFLQLIHDRIKGKLTGPIYGHCWNGWHASGLMASVALKQFCDFTDEEADFYWVNNTDGNSKGYESVRKKVRAYKMIAGLEITEQEKALICPRSK